MLVARAERERPFFAIEEDEIDAIRRRRFGGLQHARRLEQQGDARCGIVRARHRRVGMLFVAIGADDAVVMGSKQDPPRIVGEEPRDDVDEAVVLAARVGGEALFDRIGAARAQFALDIVDGLLVSRCLERAHAEGELLGDIGQGPLALPESEIGPPVL